MLTLKQRRFAYVMSRFDDFELAIKEAEIDRETGVEFLNDADVAATIDTDRLAGIAASLETRERVIARYANWADNDPGDYMLGGEAGWELKPPEMLTPNQRRRIKKISHNQWGTTVEFYDSMRANDKLAELLGLVADTGNDESAEDKAKQIRGLVDEMERATTGVTTH